MRNFSQFEFQNRNIRQNQNYNKFIFASIAGAGKWTGAAGTAGAGMGFWGVLLASALAVYLSIKFIAKISLIKDDATRNFIELTWNKMKELRLGF